MRGWGKEMLPRQEYDWKMGSDCTEIFSVYTHKDKSNVKCKICQPFSISATRGGGLAACSCFRLSITVRCQ